MPSTASPDPSASRHPTSTPKEYLRSEDAEIACWRAALHAPSVRVRSSLGLRVIDNEWGVALICAGVDHVMLNRVFLRPPADGDCERELMELLSVHQQEGVTRFFVHLSEHADPRVLHRLEDAGLVRYPRSWVKLHARIDTADPGALSRANRSAKRFEVRQVTAREATQFAELFCTGFNLPETAGAVYEALVGTAGFDTFGAFAQDRLAAASVAHYHGHTAYLAGGVTAPGQRKQGLQQALISARQRAAISRQCRDWCTETGEERPGQPQHSERNLRRHGLRPIGRRHNFALPNCQW